MHREMHPIPLWDLSDFHWSEVAIFQTFLHSTWPKIMSFQYFFTIFYFLERSSLVLSILKVSSESEHSGDFGAGLSAKIHDFCQFDRFYCFLLHMKKMYTFQLFFKNRFRIRFKAVSRPGMVVLGWKEDGGSIFFT